MRIAPDGTDNIIAMMCGTCSNENAMKLMFMKYAEKMRGGRVDFTEQELASAMVGEVPGIPKMCVISFHGSFHGRTVGCLSVTHSKPIHLVDIPLMGWPVHIVLISLMFHYTTCRCADTRGTGTLWPRMSCTTRSRTTPAWPLSRRPSRPNCQPAVPPPGSLRSLSRPRAVTITAPATGSEDCRTSAASTTFS